MSRAGPLVMSVADLLRRPGTRREAHVEAELADVAVSFSGVPVGAAVVADVVLESLSDAVVVTGTVAVPWEGECRRCLERVDGVVVAAVREVFDPQPVEGETYPLAGETLDLEPMVRDAALLALPLVPVCDEACAGPEPQDYPVAREPAPAGDPRWAKLRELSFDERSGAGEAAPA